MTNLINCPRCDGSDCRKSGIVKERQRYRCKSCDYHFTVQKMGKAIDKYYVVKALQLYLEGLSYREVERILGVSHVSVRNWVQMYKIQQPQQSQYHPSYQILTQNELQARLQDPQYLKGHGLLITELGDKFMVIRWERFKDA